MRFIWSHTPVHVLSPVDALGLYIYLALVSAEILWINWRAASPPIFLHLPSCAAVIWFFFTMCIPNTFDFCRKLQDSAQFLGLSLLVFFVQTFTEEAPKLQEKFRTYFMKAGSSILSNNLVGILSRCRVSDHMNFFSGCVFFGILLVVDMHLSCWRDLVRSLVDKDSWIDGLSIGRIRVCRCL